MFTGLTGSALGAAVGLGTSLYGTHTSKSEARAADRRSMDNWLSQMVYGNLYGPSLQRQGLEKAGYNPMLALDKSGFNAGVPSSNVGQPFIGDIASSARSGGELAKSLGELYDLQKQQARANVKKTENEAELIKAAKYKTNVDTGAGVVNALGTISNIAEDSSPYPVPAMMKAPKVDPKSGVVDIPLKKSSLFWSKLNTFGSKYWPLLMGGVKPLLPAALTAGALKLGIEAQKKKNKSGKRYSIPNAFGIPSYHNF